MCLIKDPCPAHRLISDLCSTSVPLTSCSSLPHTLCSLSSVTSLPHPGEKQPRNTFFLADQLPHPNQLHRCLIRTACRFRAWRAKLLFSHNGHDAAQDQGTTGTKVQVTSWSTVLLNHRIVESFWLEITTKVIQSNRELSSAKCTSNPCP